MAFDDKKFGTIFPTRHGTPTGASNERQMLDRLGGSESFRKTYRTLPDGRIVRCETKNGMPQFIVEGTENINIITPTLYMESGQLEFSYPGENNPEREDPALWRFLDITTTDKWLGQALSNGDQKNVPALSDGQNSKAIGLTTATVTKKVISAWFPASLFSGKMRKFVQAIYGAKETSDFPLSIDVSGGSASLIYTGKNGGTVQFGLWAHHSPGIFTANDGTWWFITITYRDSSYVVTTYPIKHTAAGRTLRTEYLKEGLSSDDKDKCESYIFAHSYIDTNAPEVIGIFPGTLAPALAYGWKWNSTGSEASVVIHELLGTGTRDYRWKASILKLTFAYPLNVTCSFSETAAGEWTDGYGAFNIFVPEDELSLAPLVLKSLAIDNTGVMPAFSYSDVPVYGYYVNDIWTPVSLSRVIGNVAGSPYIQSYDGLYIHDAYANSPGVYAYGQHLATQGWWYESVSSTTVNLAMSLSFNGLSLSGSSKYGSHLNVLSTPGAQTDYLGYINDALHESMSAYTGLIDVPRTAAFQAALDAKDRNEFPLNGNFVSFDSISITQETWSFVGWRHHAWVLVIPSNDAESIFTAERSWDVPNGVVTHNTTVAINVPSMATAHGYANSTPTSYTYEVYHAADVTLNVLSNFIFTTTDESVRPPLITSFFYFNSIGTAIETTPGGGLESLFTVNRYYPYYDRGIYSHTSYGKRYFTSESAKAPVSANGYPFVGWA